jgi:hypothetical protein
MKQRPKPAKPLTKAWLDRKPKDSDQVTQIAIPAEVIVPAGIDRPCLDEVVIFRSDSIGAKK